LPRPPRAHPSSAKRAPGQPQQLAVQARVVQGRHGVFAQRRPAQALAGPSSGLPVPLRGLVQASRVRQALGGGRTAVKRLLSLVLAALMPAVSVAEVTYSFDWYCSGCAKLGMGSNGREGPYGSGAACEGARATL